MIRTSGLAYITLKVADVEQSRAFYRDVLGLGEVHVSEHFVLLSAGNTQIGLHSGTVGEARTNLHFHVEDADEAYGKLQGADGVSVAEPPRRMPWGLKALSFDDPDGYRVELVES
jgi:catechol 2,3-dioxygenase-like lactoylglutathione lyase family enzyme